MKMKKDHELTVAEWVHECYAVSPSKNGPFGPLIERILAAGRIQGELHAKEEHIPALENARAEGRTVAIDDFAKWAAGQPDDTCPVCANSGRITREHAERLRVAANWRAVAEDLRRDKVTPRNSRILAIQHEEFASKIEAMTDQEERT